MNHLANYYKYEQELADFESKMYVFNNGDQEISETIGIPSCTIFHYKEYEDNKVTFFYDYFKIEFISLSEDSYSYEIKDFFWKNIWHKKQWFEVNDIKKSLNFKSLSPKIIHNIIKKYKFLRNKIDTYNKLMKDSQYKFVKEHYQYELKKLSNIFERKKYTKEEMKEYFKNNETLIYCNIEFGIKEIYFWKYSIRYLHGVFYRDENIVTEDYVLKSLNNAVYLDNHCIVEPKDTFPDLFTIGAFNLDGVDFTVFFEHILNKYNRKLKSEKIMHF